MGPPKTTVANFTELSSSPLELEGWIAAEITFWSLVAPLHQLMLLSSLSTPAGSNLTLWSWQQLFWVAPSKNFFYSSKSTRISIKNSGHTQFFMIFPLVHTKFLMQTPYYSSCTILQIVWTFHHRYKYAVAQLSSNQIGETI